MQGDAGKETPPRTTTMVTTQSETPGAGTAGVGKLPLGKPGKGGSHKKPPA